MSRRRSYWSDPYHWLAVRNDYRAAKRGRIGKRVERRVLGRAFGQLLRSLTR